MDHFKILFILAFCLFFSAVPASGQLPDSRPLEGKTVVLDPGHGGRDHGYCDKIGVCERDITLEIAREVSADLRAGGARVFLTRGGRHFPGVSLPGVDQEISLDKRISLAQSKKADVFVSIHCNTSPSIHRTGATVFYRDGFAAGRLLGDKIQRELVKIPDNGKRTDRPGSYYLLNRLPVPAVVVETCYLTHRLDKKNIADPRYREMVSSAIFSGISGYFSDQGTNKGDSAGMGPGRADPNPAAARQVSPGVQTPDLSALERLKNDLRLSGGIKLGAIALNGNRADIDIYAPPGGPVMGGEEEYRAIYDFANRALAIPGVQSLLFTVNGRPAETLAGHIDISSEVTRDNPVFNRIPFGTREGKRAQVAIVIDDFGQYSNGGTKEMLSLGIPITCAVMPHLDNTINHAEEAARSGSEVIVHLPLKPVRGKKSWLGPGSISPGMPADKIKSLVREDFAEVPYAVGFNNHMGSAVTADAGAMKAILQVAAEKEFFVLDSKTTDKSTIPAVAREVGVACLERSFFLDEIKKRDPIKKQLLKLAKEALKNGKAIGIGHVGRCGDITASALEEMIPEIEKMGIEFVYLSEMAY